MRVAGGGRVRGGGGQRRVGGPAPGRVEAVTSSPMTSPGMGCDEGLRPDSPLERLETAHE